MIRFLNQYLGWRNWSVLTHNSIIENIFVIFYIALIGKLHGMTFFLDLFFFLLFSILSTTYGYLINDFADRKLDAVHGKNNTFQDDSAPKAVFIVLLFLVFSILAGARFAEKPLFVPLWICWGLAATFYSLPPIRLKEKGKPGLLVVVLAQRFLPALLIFSAFQYHVWSDVIILSLYIFFRGLSSDLNHQISDYRKDALTETGTYAVRAGEANARKLFRYSLMTEKVMLIICLSLMILQVSFGEMNLSWIMLPLLGVYLVVFMLSWTMTRSPDTEDEINPFSPARKDSTHFIHHAYPSVVIPLYLLLILTYEDWSFFLVLILFCAAKRLFDWNKMSSSYPINAMLKALRG